MKLFCERCQRTAEPGSWSVVDGTLRLVCSGCGAVAEQPPRGMQRTVPGPPPIVAAPASRPPSAPRPAAPFAATPTPILAAAPPQLRPAEPAPARTTLPPPRAASGSEARQPVLAQAPPVAQPPAPIAEPAGPDLAWLEEGWDRLRDRWTDDEAHTRLVSEAAARNAFAELGTRYRRVLEGNPEDPHALRARDELVRRATAHLMTTMPREERGIGPAQARTVRNAMLLVFLLGVIAFGAYVLLQMGGR